ncbi:hypothetical protein H6P81_003803 [Aristolochia fimbriata]|uniref:Agenet domain-containing protein n=1 Tax=Aristolochia fimbriata TaxID=158543 RepID=A0AAV7FGI4_ARIFI|nr:hypothetical protein H6P81_003803 [Aristolochia fimbriata]
MEAPGAPVFVKGDHVEVRSDEPGFAGAWFEATILRGNPRKKRVLVEFKDLLNDDASRPLREFADVGDVRPRPPPPPPPLGPHREFAVGDKVEAFVRDGWWVGEVVGVANEARYIVRFVDGDESEIGKSGLRTSLDWIDGKWVRPPEVITSKTHDSLLLPPQEQSVVPLPFPKTPVLWRALESMEVFARFPQNPHFRPLERFSEELREGLAIAQMIGFVNLVEGMRLSRFADPLNGFMERLVVIEDLELHGFTVQGLHSHLLEMIRLKKTGEQCDWQLAELDGNEVLTHLNETNKKIVRLEESIACVQCKRSAAEERLENCTSACAKLEKEGMAMKEQMSAVKQEYDGLVTVPLMYSCV